MTTGEHPKPATAGEAKKAFVPSSNLANEAKNPCITESNMSFKCMDNNYYDREKCSKYFKNYRNCMDFWKRIQRDRKMKGIKPHLPAPEERPHIKQEYYNKWAYQGVT